MDRPETVLEVLDAAAGWLERRGVDAPRRSVELLMGHVLRLDRLHLYLAHDRPVGPDERARLRELVARRAAKEPVAHLLGHWEFYGHELEVGPDVLIPRPETEGLVELALARLPPGPRAVLDLGTGSGAIAIAIAAARTDVRVVAVDVSEPALAVARRNVARHGLTARIELRLGSWWAGVAADDGPFDLLVSNPPYVDPARPDLVADDVRRFEPGVALWTPPGEPGAAYAAIGAGIASRMPPGSQVCLETGVGADAAAREAIERCGALVDVELLDDLEGRPRYLVARVRGRGALTPASAP